jgi:class 3 adenylate cyclase/predicted ATPase
MTFEELLDEAIAMLQRRGRLTYSTLKRQFQLDDAALEDLKNELIYGQRVAADEDGRVLVWTGDADVTPSSLRPSAQHASQPVTQERSLSQTTPLSAAFSPPDAERRQLTVLFCDLVESTKLASQLDPEDWRDVVREYQRVCSEIIQRYDGHIAQLLGDGLLVYFGYPHAHEDDAQRAVHTGLGIVEAIGALNTRLEQDKGITLAMRLGIHTGVVVIGELGGAGRQEQLALGDVPNIAARIQGLAAPDSVVISDVTYRLVQGYFAFQELGAQHLRGVSQPVPIYQVLQESGVQSRLEVASTRGLTPLVGREQEVGLLLERWARAKDGHGQVVLLSGEAGIGKSRLVQVLKDHVASEPHTRWECRSSPYYQNTALYPLIDLLQRALQWRQDDTPAQRVEKLEQTLRRYRLPVEESVPLFAPLLSLSVPEDRYPPPHLSPPRQRQKTLESLVAILLELAEREPVFFILEDLHWTDPTTLEFLALLIDQTPTASLCALLTCRPTFQPAWHHRSYLTEVTVNRLSRQQIHGMTLQVAGGKRLPAEVLQQIVDKTDGVPLFVEELTKAILESGHLKEVDGHYELTGALPTLAIPATLQDSLMARLDRLMTAKVIAQLGAVIGRQFSYELLQAVSQLDAMTLQRELGRLVEAELVYQRGVPPQATYTFKHALIQDAAYVSLLKSTRQGYHRRIAEILEERFPETVEHQPELLAHHWTAAGLAAQAVDYWRKAGQRAMARSANAEAISHLQQGIVLLGTLPETRARLQEELTLQIALALACHVSKGQAVREVEDAYLRAWALCEQLDDDRQLFRVLMGLTRCYGGRGQRQKARECIDLLCGVAQRLHEPALLQEAYMMRGTLLCHDGILLSARAHLEQALTLYNPQHSRFSATHASLHPGVITLSRLSWTLWFLGYPAQALDRSQETLTLARALGHTHSLAGVCIFAAVLHLLRGEATVVQEQVDVARQLAIDYDMHQRQMTSAILQGWYVANHGQGTEGVAQMHQALTAYRATGIAQYQVWFLALLSEVQGAHGQSVQGLEGIAEALTLMGREEGERCWAPELHRIKGELLLAQSFDHHPAAEACFQHAMAIAQNQSAKSWELRAATSLARLWQQQGKRQEAYDLLAPIYGWFTEGFDTADLQEARALLDALT